MEDSNRLGRLARRRGSFLGRNLKGVWWTDGADEGGLKTMWPPPPGALSDGPGPARKDGCGWMVRERLARPDVDLWRRLVIWRDCGIRKLLRGAVDAEDRQHWAAGLVSSRTSIFDTVGRWKDSEKERGDWDQYRCHKSAPVNIPEFA